MANETRSAGGVAGPPAKRLLSLADLKAKLVRKNDPYVGFEPCRILTADPPWSFDDSLPGERGAEDNYTTLSIEEIKAFALPPIQDDAVLFLWRVSAGNEKGESLADQAYDVARAWGFKPKSELVWQKTRTCAACSGVGYTMATTHNARVWCDKCSGHGKKMHFGMGRYVRMSHEICLICTRGKPQFPDDNSRRSIFTAPVGEHSQKPDRFYDIVESMYVDGPYTELFARKVREGWQQHGNQLGVIK